MEVKTLNNRHSCPRYHDVSELFARALHGKGRSSQSGSDRASVGQSELAKYSTTLSLSAAATTAQGPQCLESKDTEF